MRKRLTVVAATVVLAVLATACGGSSSSSGGGAAAGTIRLGFSAWPGWFPWQVAEEMGFFTKHGLKVELTYFESYTDSLNALASGNLDANSQTLNDTVSSVAGGAKQTIVLTNDNSTGNDQIIAGPGIGSVADLKGKKVGAEQGTVDHYLFLLALRKAGLGPSDVDFQPLETGAAAAAFASGRLDAVGAFAPFTTQARPEAGRRPWPRRPTSRAPYPTIWCSLGTSWVPTPTTCSPSSTPGSTRWISSGPTQPTPLRSWPGRAACRWADYQSYDKGTTLFTLEDNLTAFTAGSTTASLDFEAKEISTFLLMAKLIDKAPDLTGLFEPKFVKARAARP